MASYNELLNIPGYHARLLQQGDLGELQLLLEKCLDYMLLVDGHPAGPSAAASLFSDFPSGKTAADLVLIGISTQENRLVGLLHAVTDYPETGACWIGLLLIDPEYRNQGLGKLIVWSFEDWLASRGAQGIMLGVVESNERALKFWQSVGFEVVERRPPEQIGDLTHVVIWMAHALSKVKSA